MAKKDLTNSVISRKNILNNEYAITHIESHLQLGGVNFDGGVVFTKSMVAQILDVDERTIDRYIHQYNQELKENGYRVLTSEALKKLRFEHVDDINVVDINIKVPSLSVFSFRAVLNLAMLITESERAKAIRSRILDIVIDVVAERSGGHTKYINQRDYDYMPAALEENNYRRQFTDALREHLDMGNHKYLIYTDKIYKAIFLENSREYKKILNLVSKDNARDTMYSEVLKAIASFESGLATQIIDKAQELSRKLKPTELDKMIEDALTIPFLKPVVDDARVKMASRDLGFRDVLHERLEHYVKAVSKDDFERFLGEKSASLEEQLSDPKILEILLRLKDR